MDAQLIFSAEMTAMFAVIVLVVFFVGKKAGLTTIEVVSKKQP